MVSLAVAPFATIAYRMVAGKTIDLNAKLFTKRSV